MIEFFKYLKGYVRIRVTGFSPERFMNLCSNRDILLWDIRRENDDTYLMSLSIKGFYKLRPIVKKTGTRVAIVNRCGLPFFSQRVRKRKFFLIGFLLAVFFLVWTTRYIWAIEIEGNFSVTSDVIMDFLKENNVYTGMNKKELNIEELEKSIRKEYEQITWTSAKLEGTKLSLQIKENEYLKTGMPEETAFSASDLVASTDGVIVSMIVRSGVPMVQIGQEVTAGEVLVSGSVPVYNEDATVRKYQYCNSDADIVVEHQIQMKEKLSFFYNRKTYTGREKKKSYVHFMRKSYPVSLGRVKFLYADSITREKQLQLLPDFYLPVTWRTSTFREYYIEECRYTAEEGKRILNKKYEKFIATLDEKGVQIIEKDVKIDTNGSKWTMTGDFIVREKTGISREIREETADLPENKEAEE